MSRHPAGDDVTDRLREMMENADERLRRDAENICTVIFWRKKAHRARCPVRFFSCGRHVFACRSIFSTFSLYVQQSADLRERENEILARCSVALPAFYRSLWQAKAARKFRLRQPQIFPEIAH